MRRAAVASTGGAASLAAALRGWAPPRTHTARRVDPWPAAAFAAALDAPAPPLEPGDPLPPLWHWFTLLDHPARTELGPDGHVADGAFLPPVPHRRRMFAGGRLRVLGPIPVGAELSCRAGVAEVAVKRGRSGELAFVTVRRELSVAGAPVAVEDQQLVYRSQPDGAPRPAPPAAEPAGEQPADPDWRLELATDPVLLFHLSALTYNGHRIHYDHPYATEVEGYPGLVVHGPLLALLALELPRRNAPAARVTEFDYRLVRPAFCGSTLQATGRRAGRRLALQVGVPGAGPCCTATATLDAER